MRSYRVGSWNLVSWLAPLNVALLLTLNTGCEQKTPPANTTPAPEKAVEQTNTEAEPAGDDDAQPNVTSADFIARADGTDLRLVSYNILWNTIFPEVNPRGTIRFERVVKALKPDVLALQEIGTHPRDRNKPTAKNYTADDVVALMNKYLPLGDGATWYGHQGNDNVIVSRYPLTMTRTATVPAGERDQAIALVDLPDEQMPIDLYVMNNHYKCCNPEKNDVRRQQQSDSIVNWLRDARTPGGEIDLPANTAIAVVGDLNIVGSFQPIDTLTDGDIQDEEQYGPDSKPDWDDTEMLDLGPMHNVVGPDDYTWRDDTSEYDPGRLDYIIYSDSVLEPLRAYVLNTTLMSEEALKEAGLKKHDVTVDTEGAEFDHLPLVVDFAVHVQGG